MSSWPRRAASQADLPAPARARARPRLRERRLHGHSFVETSEAGYTLTIVERAIGTSRAAGRFGDDTAAPKAEARRHVEEGTFFGRIAYVSLVAGEPSWGQPYGTDRRSRLPLPGSPLFAGSARKV